MDLNPILAGASLLIFAALVAYFAFLVRHQEQVEPEEKPLYGVELLEQHYAPGATVEQPTPYYVAPIPASPDPLEIAGNLDKKIVVGGAMLFAIFGMIGGYFVAQGSANPIAPGGIRAAATERQLRQDIERGKHVYASLCYDCHGRDGRGGKTPDGAALPGLPLNKPDFKFENMKEDPAKVADVRKLIEQTIARGRKRPPPAYSMPAWARSEGGPLSPWQIKQVADLIMYGTADDWGDLPQVRETSHPPLKVAEQIPPPPPPPSGRDIALSVCTRCHSFTDGQASVNPLAPNLAGYAQKGPFADELKRLKASDPAWLAKWVTDPSTVKPGSPMPAYGPELGENGVKLVVQFLLEGK